MKKKIKRIEAEELTIHETPLQGDQFDNGICIVMHKKNKEVYMYIQPEDTDYILNQIMKIRKKHNVDNSKLFYV